MDDSLIIFWLIIIMILCLLLPQTAFEICGDEVYVEWKGNTFGKNMNNEVGGNPGYYKVDLSKRYEWKSNQMVEVKDE